MSLAGLAAHLGHQLAIGRGHAHATAAAVHADGGFGLQVEQFVGVGVVRLAVFVELDVKAVALTGRTTDGGLEADGFLRTVRIQHRLTGGVQHRHIDRDLVVLTRHDRALADFFAFLVQHAIALNPVDRFVKGQPYRHRAFDLALRQPQVRAAVDIQRLGQVQTTDHAGSTVGATLARHQRTGQRQRAGIGHLHAHVGRATAGRADFEAVALVQGAAIELEGKAVNFRRRFLIQFVGPHDRTVGTLHRVVVVAAERHLIVVGGQRAAVGDGDIQVAGTCAVAGRAQAALTDGFGTVDVVEQRRAELAVGIQALPQLLVDRVGNHQRRAPQLIDRRGQHIVTVTNQAADLAAADHRGDVRAGRRVVDLNRVLALVGFTRHSRKRVGGVAQHQGLTGAEGDVVHVVVLLHRHADQLVERAHGFIARIHQVVRGVAPARRLGDLLVQRSNGRCVLVDHGGQGFQLAVHALVLLVELAGNRVEPVAQGLGVAQQQVT